MNVIFSAGIFRCRNYNRWAFEKKGDKDKILFRCKAEWHLSTDGSHFTLFNHHCHPHPYGELEAIKENIENDPTLNQAGSYLNTLIGIYNMIYSS